VDAEARSVESETFREAARAVQARRPGREPAAVRAALEAELARRGVTDPDPERVERLTRILEAQGPFASLRVAREISGWVGELRDALKGKQGPEWLRPPAGHEVGIPAKEDLNAPGFSMETTEVELSDVTQPFLAEAFETSYDPEKDDEGESLCKVWIDTRRLPPSGEPLAVILGTELIGTLDGEDALTLERDLRTAESKRQPLILEAWIERERDRFSVSVVVPPNS
jgi:hypothetical protein